MDMPIIPDYRIISCCGSGAYGDVWLAEDRDGLKRAVKVLDKARLANLGVLGREEKAIRLFRNKVPEHPNLIRIYHSGETETLLYYAMEIADSSGGGDAYAPDTLESRLRKGGALPEGQIKPLMNALAAAVHCLHSNGIVHRDIKPSNIVYVDGVAKLADVGLASSGDHSVSTAGTIHFIPPEKSSGFEADIYALGKVLYCAFTGFGPERFPSLPEDLNSGAAALFNQIAIKACSPARADRFGSIDEFTAALNGGYNFRPGLGALFRNRKYLLYGILAVVLVWLFAISYFMLKEKIRQDKMVEDAVRDAKRVAEEMKDSQTVIFDDSGLELPSDEDSARMLEKYSDRNKLNSGIDEKEKKEGD